MSIENRVVRKRTYLDRCMIIRWYCWRTTGEKKRKVCVVFFSSIDWTRQIFTCTWCLIRYRHYLRILLILKQNEKSRQICRNSSILFWSLARRFFMTCSVRQRARLCVSEREKKWMNAICVCVCAHAFFFLSFFLPFPFFSSPSQVSDIEIEIRSMANKNSIYFGFYPIKSCRWWSVLSCLLSFSMNACICALRARSRVDPRRRRRRKKNSMSAFYIETENRENDDNE